MPKVRTEKASVHLPSVKLDGGFDQAQAEVVEGASGDSRNAMRKKEKSQLKHDTFIDKLKSSRSSFSKNQKRRFKKKQKEQLGGGLGDIQAAITALDGDEDDDGRAEQTGQGVVDESVHQKVKPKPGRIGEGKGVPLKQNQRRRALEMERLRAPMILANPDYASNPFQTIRTHAQNTLLKHEHPAS